MADPKNPGQFGNRDEAEAQEARSRGGNNSSGSFGEKNSADPHIEGQKGAKAQPTEAKRRGGQNSRRRS